MEKWREIYTQDQILKIQKLEIQNLKEIDRVCSILQIDYIAYGGTMIGAVRHKGFIPWDDDLDIAMVRDDYMKFIREAPKLLSSLYYLQTPYSDKKSPYLYTKLRLKGTSCIEYCHSKLNIEKGIYVDIYPIDNVPDDDNLYKRQHEEFQKIARCFALRQCPYPEVCPNNLYMKFKAIIKALISSVLKIIPHKFFVNKMDKIMTKYNKVNTKRKGTLFFPKATNVFYDFYPLQNGVFEGMKIKLPGNWARHLEMRYGNYMEFPPEEERIGHKPFLLDFGTK